MISKRYDDIIIGTGLPTKNINLHTGEIFRERKNHFEPFHPHPCNSIFQLIGICMQVHLMSKRQFVI